MSDAEAELARERCRFDAYVRAVVEAATTGQSGGFRDGILRAEIARLAALHPDWLTTPIPPPLPPKPRAPARREVAPINTPMAATPPPPPPPPKKRRGKLGPVGKALTDAARWMKESKVPLARTLDDLVTLVDQRRELSLSDEHIAVIMEAIGRRTPSTWAEVLAYFAPTLGTTFADAARAASAERAFYTGRGKRLRLHAKRSRARETEKAAAWERAQTALANAIDKRGQ